MTTPIKKESEKNDSNVVKTFGESMQEGVFNTPIKKWADIEKEFDRIYTDAPYKTEKKLMNQYRKEYWVGQRVEPEKLKAFLRQTLKSTLEATVVEERERIRKSKIWQLVPNTPRMIMCKDSELDELLKPRQQQLDKIKELGL